MAETTSTTRTFHNFGDLTAVTIVCTSVTDGDVLTTGLDLIYNAVVTCNTLGTPIDFGVSFSGGVVTFDTSANGKQFTVTAFGK